MVASILLIKEKVQLNI